MPREIEGDWIWGWPDRKRPHLLEGKDSQGRVIFQFAQVGVTGDYPQIVPALVEEFKKHRV